MSGTKSFLQLWANSHGVGFIKRESSKIVRSLQQKGNNSDISGLLITCLQHLGTTIKHLSKQWPSKADSPTELCSCNIPNLNGTIQLYQQYATSVTCVKEVRSSCHKRFPMETIRLSTLETSMAVHQLEVTVCGLGQNAASFLSSCPGRHSDSPASAPRKPHLMLPSAPGSQDAHPRLLAGSTELVRAPWIQALHEP